MGWKRARMDVHGRSAFWRWAPISAFRARLGKKEAGLQASRLFLHSPTGIAVVRVTEPGNAGSLRLVDMNPAGKRMAEASGENIDVPLREFAPELYETGIPDVCLSVLKSGESVTIRDYPSRRRAAGKYFDMTIFPLSDTDVGVAFEDVSARQKAQRILLDSSQLLLLMLDSVREYAIFRLDTEERVASWTRGAELIYGYGADEILGSPYARFFPPGAAAEDVPRKQIDEALRGGAVKAEHWSVRKDGARFWADVALTTLRDEAGTLLGYAGVVRDATKRRGSDESAAKRSDALARSNVELSQFAYVASHDLSEPLHKVKAFGDRLKEKLEGKLDAEAGDYLRRMLRAIDGMQNLINSLMELARVTTRGGAPEVVDLAELAKDVVEDLDITVARTRARVEIGPLPRIHADPLQMRQLLNNLISNSLKFQRAEARPHVRIHGRTTEDGLCEILVSDNGIGFEMKYVDRIFQPFQRLHGRFEYEGTGMGLAICQKIAARHGGTISATSTPGRGSEFKVVLPVSQEERMKWQSREKAFS